MQKISFNQYHAWLAVQSDFLRQAAFFDDAAEFEEEGVQFYAGDQVLDVISPAPLAVVDGNLTVERLSHEFDTGMLVVRGDLVVPSIDKMTITIAVGGNVVATALCLNSLNDYRFAVGGDIRCDHLAEYGCHVEVQGRIVCPKGLNMMNSVTARGGFDGVMLDRRRGQRVDDILVSEVLGGDGRFSEERFLAHVIAGGSPFRR